MLFWKISARTSPSLELVPGGSWATFWLLVDLFAAEIDNLFLLLQPFLYSLVQPLKSDKASFSDFTSSVDVNPFTKVETSMKCWRHLSAASSELSVGLASNSLFHFLGLPN